MPLGPLRCPRKSVQGRKQVATESAAPLLSNSREQPNPERTDTEHAATFFADCYGPRKFSVSTNTGKQNCTQERNVKAICWIWLRSSRTQLLVCPQLNYLECIVHFLGVREEITLSYLSFLLKVEELKHLFSYLKWTKSVN